MASGPPDRPQVCYFCDESSHVKQDWLAVGGMAVMKKAIPRIAADLAAIKAKSGKRGEVKWRNAKSFGGRVHRGYIDYLFLLIETRKAHFHIRFSEMAQYDHALSGPRMKIDTVSKSYYQLLLHRAIRYYHGKADVWAYPDDGECTDLLPEMIDPLSIEGYRLFGEAGRDCIQDIQCRSSVSEPMLQLLDVTLGALTAFRNRRHLQPGYSAVKRELAEYAFQKTGWWGITGSSLMGRKDCNRWNVRPKFRLGRGQ